MRIVDISRSANLSVDVQSVKTSQKFDVKISEVGWGVKLPVTIEGLGSSLSSLPVEVKR